MIFFFKKPAFKNMPSPSADSAKFENRQKPPEPESGWGVHAPDPIHDLNEKTIPPRQRWRRITTWSTTIAPWAFWLSSIRRRFWEHKCLLRVPPQMLNTVLKRTLNSLRRRRLCESHFVRSDRICQKKYVRFLPHYW